VWINAWDPSVWNSVNTVFSPYGFNATNGYCDIDAWIRTSATFTNASITLWEDQGSSPLKYLSSYNIYPSTTYSHVSWTSMDVSDAVHNSKNVYLALGYWGQGSGQWIQVDDVHVECWVYD